MSKAQGHWTQTPEGRKKMSEIATKAAQAPGAKQRLAEIARKSHARRRTAAKSVRWGAHRVDVSEATRVLIAKRYYNSGRTNTSDLAREFGVSTTTVRTWAKQYGQGRRVMASSNGARPSAQQACGACRTCLLCRRLGAEPQWLMCLVASPLEGGVV